MGIGIVFTGVVVTVATDRLVRRQFFQPLGVIVMQTTLVVVNKDTGGDVHGINQHQALAHATLTQALIHLFGDADKGHAGGRIKPQFFTVTFHADIPRAKVKSRQAFYHWRLTNPP